MSNQRGRIPVSIITGFLGAGKSTLLNRILKDPGLKDTAVIINEFGEVGIDHLLVETSDDSVIELSDGCLCCTVRGELVDTLAMLVDRMQTGRSVPLRRVVIETTGLADPTPVMQSVMGNPAIAQHFELDGVITVIDAVNGPQTLARHPEAVRQAAVADRMVLTKISLSDAAAVSALRMDLLSLNPRAPVTDAEAIIDHPAEILENGLYDATTKIADVGRWLRDELRHDHLHRHDHEHGEDCDCGDHHHPGQGHGHHHHDINRHGETIRSFSIMHDRVMEPVALDMFIDLLRSAHGEQLLRFKAIVALSDNPDRPVVLHGVQTIFHPPQRLPQWPDPDDRRTRMVLITDGLPEAFVKDLFQAFAGVPRIDRPDTQALADNPLAVPGMKF